MRVAYLECFAGLSGDMFLGALLDAGVSVELLRSTVASLNLGATLDVRNVNRSGISATQVVVMVGERRAGAPDAPNEHTHGDASRAHHHVHSHGHEQSHEQAPAVHTHARSLKEIRQLIGVAPIADGAKSRALRIFQSLGEVEAHIHNVPVEQVHFHEVGAVDTIVDIVCGAVGAESLGISQWYCSRLNVGGGTVECAHGSLPVPAPATLALLQDAPVYSAGPQKELLTPTGAAILRALDVRYASFPMMRVERTGYGAGGHDFPRFPNVVRLTLGEEVSESLPAAATTIVIETTIDDANPQVLSYVSDLLLEAGASDVVRTPVQMKKGRTGVLLTVLSPPARAAALREILFRETTTIGLRYREEQKIALHRSFTTVDTEWGPVSIKVASLEDGRVMNAAPEYEDCRAIAAAHGIPLKQVIQQAQRLYEAQAQQGRPNK